MLYFCSWVDRQHECIAMVIQGTDVQTLGRELVCEEHAVLATLQTPLS